MKEGLKRNSVNGYLFLIVLLSEVILSFSALGYQEAAGRLKNREGTETGISLSIGIAKALPEEDFQHIYKKADEALYEVKKGGKNNFGFYSG